MQNVRREYIPALNQSWLTPLYDPLLRHVMREDSFKRRLVLQANVQPGQRVLDLGCGTGTLTILLWQAQPRARITGLDVDARVLHSARQKARRAEAADIRWDRGLAGALPYPDETFDRVLSSLMLHHLAPAEKMGAFREVLRVLAPGGEFHIADFGPPHDRLMRLVTGWMSRLEQTADNFAGRIVPYLCQAGFTQAEETGRLRSIFGPLSLYRALPPVSGIIEPDEVAQGGFEGNIYE